MNTARFSVRLPSLLSAALLAAFVAAPAAHAHIGYSGRDFGTLEVGDSGSIAIANVGGGFGWADATDADFGDSHRGRFFRFSLTAPTTVVITAERNTLGAVDDLLPAFSVFGGLGHLAPHQGSHDSAALSVASRPPGTEGNLRALDDWSIGNDPTYVTPGDPTSGVALPASLRFFTYFGHAADGTAANFGPAAGIVGDGAADGYVSGVFANLPAGDYSVFVGGADYGLQSTQTGPSYPTYGVTLSVQAIPEPATFGALAALGALGLAATRRRRR